MHHREKVTKQTYSLPGSWKPTCTDISASLLLDCERVTF